MPGAEPDRAHPDLDDEHARAWALLDTFDMWAPAYDQPQSKNTIRKWFVQGGFANIEVFRDGFFVGRGVKQGAR